MEGIEEKGRVLNRLRRPSAAAGAASAVPPGVLAASPSGAYAESVPGPSSGVVAGWVAALAGMGHGVGDAELINQLRVLEDLKAAAAAAQARAAVVFEASQRRAQTAGGVPAARLGQGIAAQVALARRESPARGDRLLGTARGCQIVCVGGL